MIIMAQTSRVQTNRRSEVTSPRDAVEPALPGHLHRPLEGVTRPRRGAGVDWCL